MMKIVYIGLGGALGALLRYALVSTVQKFYSPVYPMGTLAVNLAGSFAAGFLWHALEDSILSPHVRLFLFVGILGAFTTFSTYMLETMNLLRDGETGPALLNIVLHNCTGIVMVAAGFSLSYYLIHLAR